MVIAVRNDVTADYLRHDLKWPGIILNLRSMGYFGLDVVPAALLARFPECGDNSHVPDAHYCKKDPNTCLWPPLAVRKRDKSWAYIRCTKRSVLHMRWYTEYWYPTLCTLKGNHAGRIRLDEAAQSDQIFRDYMVRRCRELQRRFPTGDWTSQFRGPSQEWNRFLDPVTDTL